MKRGSKNQAISSVNNPYFLENFLIKVQIIVERLSKFLLQNILKRKQLDMYKVIELGDEQIENIKPIYSHLSKKERKNKYNIKSRHSKVQAVPEQNYLPLTV